MPTTALATRMATPAHTATPTRPSKVARLVRPAVAVAVATALGMAVVALAGSPARAADDDINVRIGGLSSSLTAGSRGDGFSVRVENRTERELTVVRVITVRLDGLTAEHVRVTRGFDLPRQGQSDGMVRFADPMSVPLSEDDSRGDSASTNYQIRFLDGTPSGRASVTVEAYVGQERSGSDSDSLMVRGNESPPTTPPRTTAAPTEPPSSPTTVPTAAAGPPTSLSTLDAAPAANTKGSSGVPVILYVLGAILVTVGAAILWLLLRPRPIAAPAGMLEGGPGPNYQPSHLARPGSPGMPNPARPPQFPQRLNPTATMPVIRDPQVPPRGTDPRAQPPR